jgi:hypothetical protein
MEFMKRVAFRANLPVIFLKEKKQFIAYTPALDLSTSGSSLKEAEQHFAEAANLFLEECYRAGTLDMILGGLGWEKKERSWVPPAIIAQNACSVSVPIPD